MHTTETELHVCLWANRIHTVCMHCIVKSFDIACMCMHAHFYKGNETLRTLTCANTEEENDSHMTVQQDINRHVSVYHFTVAGL